MAEGNPYTRSLAALFPAICGFAAVVGADLFYWRTDILAERPPDFSYGRLVRTAVIMISTFALCVSAIEIRGWQTVSTERDLDRWSPSERRAVVCTLLLSVSLLILFVSAPSLFNLMSLEDGPAEWASAIMLFGAGGLFGAAFVRQRRKLKVSRLTRVTLVVFAAGFFVLGMEEISWFQRVFELETPDMFRNNVQGEINLHNFANNLTENAFYLGAFLFLVALPFGRLSGLIHSSKDYVLFVPRPAMALVGAIACAYNYDMWNVVFIQFAFYGAVAILLLYSAIYRILPECILTVITILVVGVTQMLFLNYGENFARIWEVTEYKEFFIALGFLIYAMEVNWRMGGSC